MWLPYVYLSRESVNRKQPGIMGEIMSLKIEMQRTLPLSLSSEVSLFKMLTLSLCSFVLTGKSLSQGHCEELCKIIHAIVLSMRHGIS